VTETPNPLKHAIEAQIQQLNKRRIKFSPYYSKAMGVEASLPYGHKDGLSHLIT